MFALFSVKTLLFISTALLIICADSFIPSLKLISLSVVIFSYFYTSRIELLIREKLNPHYFLFSYLLDTPSQVWLFSLKNPALNSCFVVWNAVLQDLTLQTIHAIVLAHSTLQYLLMVLSLLMISSSMMILTAIWKGTLAFFLLMKKRKSRSSSLHIDLFFIFIHKKIDFIIIILLIMIRVSDFTHKFHNYTVKNSNTLTICSNLITDIRRLNKKFPLNFIYNYWTKNIRDNSSLDIPALDRLYILSILLHTFLSF
jgi:hypothetical protein